jgi:transposase
MVPPYARAPKGERAYAKAPRNWGRNVTLISSITTEGMGPSVSIEGSPETKSFSLYMRNVLIPRLRAGQIVLMDNLSMHKSKWVRDLVEEKGCQLWLLPSSSPDMNPIKEALSKVKNFVRKAKVRTLEALFVVTGGALEVVSKEDARGFFEACGYHTPQDHSL